MSDFELKYCPKCIQATNHIGDVCQKCRAKVDIIDLSSKESFAKTFIPIFDKIARKLNKGKHRVVCLPSACDLKEDCDHYAKYAYKFGCKISNMKLPGIDDYCCAFKKFIEVGKTKTI